MENKKPLIALAVLLVIGIVGGTIAYFTRDASFLNVFQTKKYNTELTEEFKSPEDWMPGMTTEKLVQVKNTGDIPLVARVSLVEEWVALDNSKPSSTITVDGKEERAVILNGIDTTKWVQHEEGEGKNKVTYYYYNSVVDPGTDTIKFMDSVTFNSNVEIEYDETRIITYKNEDGTGEVVITLKQDEEMTEEQKKSIEGKVKTKETKRYESKKNGYAGATYTLTIKVETVQADRYAEAWKTDIEII